MIHSNRKYLNVLLISLYLLSACGADPEAGTVEEVTDNSPSQMQIMQMGIQKLPQWIDHWEMQGREFTKTGFEIEQEVQYEPLELPEENSMGSGYPLKKYQILHPEDRGVIDIYDYKVEIDSAGKVDLNPDGEVSYFRSNGMKERLLFIGPAGVFEDAVWITGEHLLVAGHFQDDEKFTPKLWLVIPDKNVYIQYKNPFETSEYKPESYLRKKMTNLSFNE
ncbi:bifunctional isocitrate dehydrogenase kinase/phosphatase [Anditalea andensis]|uniref:Lipoprotein n=1 Tax=Anditalea andensis TaxID=1048983 RepID=A0A074KUD4_9BACT|nr:bifunctional isocitrate dehydrogenase kinase/phosphatase [Anditalea andensis]KEO72519.1 hypothetical protein EL17_17425 [Anditalea andensis]